MLVVGIAGGTGSGKTTVALALERALGEQNVAIISQDSYYLDHPELTLGERAQLNYDHPDSFENALLVTHLQALKAGEEVLVPTYDFITHSRAACTMRLSPRPVIIVEGILVLADADLRKAMDIRVYVDADADVRVLRRLTRDMQERGRSLESVVNQYLGTVKPMHDAFIEPSKRHADIIVPEGGLNHIAVELLVSRLLRQVHQSAPGRKSRGKLA